MLSARFEGFTVGGLLVEIGKKRALTLMCLFHEKNNTSYKFRLMNLNHKQNKCPGINPVSLG